MKTKQADKILAEIARLADKIENDKELAAIDERYQIVAKWIDTDITNVSLEG